MSSPIVMFIHRGRIVLNCSMEDFESRYVELKVHPDHVAAPGRSSRCMSAKFGRQRSVVRSRRPSATG